MRLISIVFLLSLLEVSQVNAQLLSHSQSLVLEEFQELYSYEFKELKKLDNAKDYKLQVLLGDAYRRGVNTEYDIEKAYKTYQKLSEKGNPIAMHRLSFLLRKGLGCKQNFQNGLSWLKKSADEGYMIAQHDYGYYLYTGNSTAKNWKTAEKYFLSACNLSIPKGSTKMLKKRYNNMLLMLGKIYSNSESQNFDIAINLPKSIQYLERSGVGDSDIRRIQSRFSTFQGFKNQTLKAKSYIPDVNINIDYASFQEVNKLIDEIWYVKEYIGTVNYSNIKKELGEVVLTSNYTRTLNSNDYRKIYISMFDKYHWLEDFKHDWCVKLEKDAIKEYDMSNSNELDAYFFTLRERQSLYTSSQQAAISKEVFPTLSDAVTSPVQIMRMNKIFENNKSWIDAESSNNAFAFTTKVSKAVKQNAKDILASNNIEFSHENLILAIIRNDTKNVELFLTGGINGNTFISFSNHEKISDDWKIFEGMTFLAASAMGNKEDVFMQILESEGTSYLKETRQGDKPISLAAAVNANNTLSILLSKSHKTSHLNEALEEAVMNDSYECASLLIENGANPKHKTDENTNILDIAAMSSSINVIKLLLSKATYTEQEKSYSLALSARDNKLEAIRTFIELGTNPNILIESLSNTTPVFVAAIKGNKDAIDVLLNNGANINKRQENDFSALTIVIIDENIDMVDFLLNKGAKGGMTDIIQAINTKNTSILENLIQKGTPVNYPDMYSQSPLKYAYKNSTTDISDILKKYGAKKSQYDLDQERLKQIEKENAIVEEKRRKREAEEAAKIHVGDYICWTNHKGGFTNIWGVYEHNFAKIEAVVEQISGNNIKITVHDYLTEGMMMTPTINNQSVYRGMSSWLKKSRIESLWKKCN